MIQVVVFSYELIVGKLPMSRLTLFLTVVIFIFFGLFLDNAANAYEQRKCDESIVESISAASQYRNPANTQCKVWPYNPSITWAAVAYDGKNGGYDVIFAAIDSKSKKMIAYSKIEVLEVYFTGDMQIDTGVYDIKKGNRAVALRLISGYTPRYADGGFSDVFHLFILEQNKLSMVIGNEGFLPMIHWWKGAAALEPPPEEINTIEYHTTISIENTTTNGYRDILLTATATGGNITKKSVSQRIQFDGKQYDIKPWESVFYKFKDDIEK